MARDSRAIPDVIAQLIAANVSVWECTRQKMSLDEMFRMAFVDHNNAEGLASAGSLRKSA